QDLIRRRERRVSRRTPHTIEWPLARQWATWVTSRPGRTAPLCHGSPVRPHHPPSAAPPRPRPPAEDHPMPDVIQDKCDRLFALYDTDGNGHLDQEDVTLMVDRILAGSNVPADSPKAAALAAE